EEIYNRLVHRRERGDVTFCVRFSSNSIIDSIGITKAVKKAIVSGTRYLASETEGGLIMLDGLLSAPSHYAQRTCIHGDDLVPIISLASIAAKVERDHLMQRMSKKYPEYGFSSHKGYPTKAHYAAIQNHGLCEIHRRSYCSFVNNFFSEPSSVHS